MDRAKQSTSSSGMNPPQPSPLSYSFQQEELLSAPQQFDAIDQQDRNRSCLPGYPNQRTSQSNTANTRRAHQLRSASTVRSKHRDVDTLLKEEIFMMDHLAIAPSTSMPTHSVMNVHDNHDLYRNHRDRSSSSSCHLLPSRGTSQNRRSRHASSSISRSATAALATPQRSSSTSSRGRSSTYHHHKQNYHASANQQYSNNSTASSGSRYNYPSGAATSASPSKRSSSRISFSSQLSSTTTAPSIHDIDDNGTVSTRRSENSVNHRHYKPPSPMSGSHVATIGNYKSRGKNSSSNQSMDSTTTKSSSGTNAMGNTEAISKRRSTQTSATSPSTFGKARNGTAVEGEDAMTDESES